MRARQAFNAMLLSMAVLTFSANQASAQVEYTSRIINSAPVRIKHELKLDTGFLTYLASESVKQIDGPLQFAIPVTVDINPSNSGSISVVGSHQVWTVAIRSEGAKSMNVIFEPFILPEGASLYVYDVRKEVIRGGFTKENNNENNILPVMPVPGEEILIEYYVPTGIDMAGTLGISQVAHDFLGVFGYDDSKDVFFGASQKCQIDVACKDDPHVQTLARSVCRILISGTKLCSGVLLNSTDRTKPPLFLTAQHCIASAKEATQTLFAFNYESAWCDGSDGFIRQTMAGAGSLVIDSNLDYALVRLLSHPPVSYRPYYSGWDVSGQVPSATMIIHHPMADVKKVTFDYDQPETGIFLDYEKNAFWRVVKWDDGATEPGSSGGPLFTQEGYVTGVLSGGFSGCSSPENDFFVKLNSMYLKHFSSLGSFRSYLDPAGYGYLKLAGRDPYLANYLQSDTITNHPSVNKLNINKLAPPGEGYSTGINSDSITGYAERFDNDQTRYILGIEILPAKVNFLYRTDSVRFRINNVINGIPGYEIARKGAALNSVIENKILRVYFTNAVKVDNDFFVSWTLPYDHPSLPEFRQFAVYYSYDLVNPEDNRAWLYDKNSKWSDFSSHPTSPGSYSFNVSVILIESIVLTSINDVTGFGDRIKLYPNPAESFINLETEGMTGTARITIIDSGGMIRLIGNYSLESAMSQRIAVDGLLPGVYHISVEYSGTRLIGRFIKTGR